MQGEQFYLIKQKLILEVTAKLAQPDVTTQEHKSYQVVLNLLSEADLHNRSRVSKALRYFLIDSYDADEALRTKVFQFADLFA